MKLEYSFSVTLLFPFPLNLKTWSVIKVVSAIMLFVASFFALLSFSGAARFGGRRATPTMTGETLASSTIPDYFQISPPVFQGMALWTLLNMHQADLRRSHYHRVITLPRGNQPGAVRTWKYIYTKCSIRDFRTDCRKYEQWVDIPAHGQLKSLLSDSFPSVLNGTAV